jgi:hypothetical protein
MLGLVDPAGEKTRFPAKGKKCWRARDRECLRLGIVVDRK